MKKFALRAVALAATAVESSGRHDPPSQRYCIVLPGGPHSTSIPGPSGRNTALARVTQPSGKT